MEGRRPAKGNEYQGHISRTQGRSKDMSQALERIRLAVRRADGQASAPRQEPDAVTPHVRFSEGGGGPKGHPYLDPSTFGILARRQPPSPASSISLLPRSYT